MQRRQQQMYQQQQSQQQRQMSNLPLSSNNLSSSNLSMMHQRPAHSQTHQPLSSPYDSSSSASGRYKIIPDVPNHTLYHSSHSMHPPFKKSHCTIQNITLQCINMVPYTDNDSLISVVDFNRKLFPKLSFDNCIEHLSVLKIQQYVGNR